MPPRAASPSLALLLGAGVLVFQPPARAGDWAAVCTAPNDQSAVLSVPGNAGDVFFAWIDARTGPNTDVYVQRMTSAGAPGPAQGWPAQGAALTSIGCSKYSLALAPDGVGGALAAWTDERCDGATRTYASRIRADGGLQPGWPLNGVLVQAGTGRQSLPAIAPDLSGGAYVAWVDTTGTTAELRLTHLNLVGGLDPAWPSAGALVVTGLRRGERPVLVPDASGGVYVAWCAQASGGTDLLVQRYTVTGARSSGWNSSGVGFCRASGDALGMVAAPDGAGGILATWLDGRTSPPHIYAARRDGASLKPTGWNTDGNRVAAASSAPARLAIQPDGSGGAFVAWQETRTAPTGQDVFAQRITGSGGIASGWATNGIAATTAPANQGSATLAPDGAGGVYVCWTDLRASAVSAADLYVQRLSGSGAMASGWASGGTLVTDAPAEQSEPRLVTDGAGGAFVGWLDRRDQATTGTDLWMGRVSSSGPLTTQVQGLQVLHRFGQTFLTWNPPPGTGWSYRVYRSSQPIRTRADLAGATPLWALGDSSALDRRLSVGLGTLQGYAVDSAAGPLNPTKGLYVVTPTANGAAWYAVTAQHAGAAEDRSVTPGSNALASAVTEVVDAPRLVYQRRITRNGRQSDIYTLWTSTTDTPGFPAMATRNGMAFDCAVTPSSAPQLGALLIRPHSRGGSFLDCTAGSSVQGEWVLAVDDPLPNGENTFWFGYHPSYDVLSNSNPPPTSGPVVDYTFRRIRYTLDWAMRNFPLDPARVYAFGYSMGGIGATQLAMWLPDRIAAIVAVVNKFDFSYLNEPDPTSWFNTGANLRTTVDRMWGTVPTSLPSTENLPTFEWLDMGTLVTRAGTMAVPPMLVLNGKRDNVTGWAEKVKFYDRMRTSRRGGIFLWSPEDHYVTGGGYWVRMIDLARLHRFRIDRSFPALSNCDLDSDPGNGTFASGDSIGTINAYVEWDTSLVDLPDQWRVTLRLRDLPTTNSVLPAPESCRVDVTPDRLQNFHAVMGTPVPYRVVRFSDGAVLATGAEWPDTLGRVTFHAVRVMRTGTMLAIGPGSSSLLEAPLAMDQRPLDLAVRENPVRGRSVLVLRGAGADQAPVELFDVAGRLLRRWPGGATPTGASARELDLPALRPGVYLARAEWAGVRRVRRVVVLE